jgi:hypothetical protein
MLHPRRRSQELMSGRVEQINDTRACFLCVRLLYNDSVLE